MVVRNSLSLFSEIISYSINQFRKIYLSSNIYNKKISKIHLQSLVYKPSPNLLDCLIKYKKKNEHWGFLFKFNLEWKYKF